MSFNLPITGIKIVYNTGADFISLESNLQDGCWHYKAKATFDTRVAKDTAMDYCKKNFPGVPIEEMNKPVVVVESRYPLSNLGVSGTLGFHGSIPTELKKHIKKPKKEGK